MILKDLSSPWRPANLGEGEAIPIGHRVIQRGDFYTEIAEGTEFTESAGSPDRVDN